MIRDLEVRLERFGFPLHPAPADAGDRHQHRAQDIRRAQTRQHQVDQAAESGEGAQPLQWALALTAHQRGAEHRDLDRTEQDQCAHPGFDPHVGDREGRGVDHQRQGRVPAPGRRRLGRSPHRPSAHDPRQAHQHRGSGSDPDRGEAGGIGQTTTQSHTPEQGIGGEGQQDAGGEQGEAHRDADDAAAARTGHRWGAAEDALRDIGAGGCCWTQRRPVWASRGVRAPLGTIALQPASTTITPPVRIAFHTLASCMA